MLWFFSLEIVAFRPLKKRFGIMMMWFICLCFSMYSVLVPKSQYHFFGLGILMLWCCSSNPDVVVYVPPQPRFRYHRENRKNHA